MASSGIYTTLLQNAGFTKEEWESRVIRGAVANAVMVNLVTQYPSAPGSKLHIPRITPPTAQETTLGAAGDEGADATLATISDADAEITPTNIYSGFKIPFSAEAELAARAGIWAGEMEWALTTSLDQKLDTVLTTLYSGLSTTVNAAGDALIWDDLVAGVKSLEKANAPRDPMGLYYGVFHPESFDDFMGIDEVTKTGDYMGNRVDIVAGRYGLRLPQLGLHIFFDTNIVESTFKKNMIFSTRAFGLAYNTGMIPREEESVLKQSHLLSWDMNFASGELTDAYAVIVNSPAS